MINAPWATLADLPESKPSLDDDTWTDLLTQASEMLYLWSGKQYSGSAESTVVLEHPPGERQPDAWPYWHYWGDPWFFQGCWRVRGRVVAKLPDAPVTAVTSVTRDGIDVPYVAELPSGIVYREDGHPWHTGTTIVYNHGIAPPIGGKRAAVQLALELGKSWTGGRCNLPSRIENITREGITIGLVSTLQGWRTGIWDIDAWLSSVNPHMFTRRASAWSPDAARIRRTTT
jgi:hypothetical protein